MSDEDLRKIGQLIDEKLNHKLDEKLGALEQRFDQKLSDLEKRFDKKLIDLELRIESKFDQKLENMAVRINTDIGQFMEDILIPIINQKADKSDLERIERKLDIALARIDNHELIHMNRFQQ